jgi:hypothetical protein
LVNLNPKSFNLNLLKKSGRGGIACAIFPSRECVISCSLRNDGDDHFEVRVELHDHAVFAVGNTTAVFGAPDIRAVRHFLAADLLYVQKMQQRDLFEVEVEQHRSLPRVITQDSRCNTGFECRCGFIPQTADSGIFGKIHVSCVVAEAFPGIERRGSVVLGVRHFLHGLVGGAVVGERPDGFGRFFRTVAVPLVSAANNEAGQKAHFYQQFALVVHLCAAVYVKAEKCRVDGTAVNERAHEAVHFSVIADNWQDRFAVGRMSANNSLEAVDVCEIFNIHFVFLLRIVWSAIINSCFT